MRQRPRLSPFSLARMALLACTVASPTHAAASPSKPRVLSLSTTSVNFGSISAGTSTVSLLTVSNTGTATIQLKSVTLSATGTFVLTNGCGATLAPGATCGFSLQFRPQLPGSYTATLTVRDNASPSKVTVTLTGTGSTPAATTPTLYTFPESDNSVTPLYALVNAAAKTIDMTMYELVDTTFSGDLVAACNRGVKVRVILDQNNEKSYNLPAYTQLNAAPNCSAVWANTAFQATHQKSFLLDGTQAVIMSLNLTTRYYATSRDFALLTSDAADIAAIQAAFNADYAAGTPPSGTPGASDFSYAPGPGIDLVWSPTTAQAALTSIIANAKSTLLIENEELGVSATYILSALESACQRGVTVNFAIVDQVAFEPSLKALEAAGCGVHVYPNSSTGFYIHAKAVVADFGLATQTAFMGSINYSNPSITENRELGLYIADPAVVQSLHTTMAADYAGGSPL